MAVTVARVHHAMANAALPGLLPTPPKSAMLLPTAACVPISPAKSKPKPGQADAVERWDAHKASRPGSPSPSSSSLGSSPRSVVSTTSSSPGSASSCERWDSNKKTSPSVTTSSSGKKKCDSSSKRPRSRSSSAERWDLHKKPRPHGDGMGIGDGEKTTTTMDKPMPQAVYAGPGFVNAPEPCMLPIPAFLVRAR